MKFWVKLHIIRSTGVVLVLLCSCGGTSNCRPSVEVVKLLVAVLVVVLVVVLIFVILEVVLVMVLVRVFVKY